MKAIKILFTLCVFALTLQTSFAQTELGGPIKPGAETKDDANPCDDAYTIFHLLVFDQDFANPQQLKYAIKAAKTRMSNAHKKCIGRTDCAGISKFYVNLSRQHDWKTADEFEKIVTKHIGNFTKEMPNCDVSMEDGGRIE